MPIAQLVPKIIAHSLMKEQSEVLFPPGVHPILMSGFVIKLFIFAVLKIIIIFFFLLDWILSLSYFNRAFNNHSIILFNGLKMFLQHLASAVKR